MLFLTGGIELILTTIFSPSPRSSSDCVEVVKYAINKTYEDKFVVHDLVFEKPKIEISTGKMSELVKQAVELTQKFDFNQRHLWLQHVPERYNDTNKRLMPSDCFMKVLDLTSSFGKPLRYWVRYRDNKQKLLCLLYQDNKSFTGLGKYEWFEAKLLCEFSLKKKARESITGQLVLNRFQTDNFDSGWIITKSELK